MRYIKEYKIFESWESLKENAQTLDDICQELKDDGYEVFVRRSTNMYGDSDTEYGKEGISVDVEIPVPPFAYSLVKEFFNRMNDYMSSEGWSSKLLHKKHGYSSKPYRFYETDKDSSAYCYRIEFFHKD